MGTSPRERFISLDQTGWDKQYIDDKLKLCKWKWRQTVEYVLIGDLFRSEPDDSFLRAMRNRQRDHNSLASSRDESRYGRLGKITGPGQPQRNQLPARVLFPLRLLGNPSQTPARRSTLTIYLHFAGTAVATDYPSGPRTDAARLCVLAGENRVDLFVRQAERLCRRRKSHFVSRLRRRRGRNRE